MGFLTPKLFVSFKLTWIWKWRNRCKKCKAYNLESQLASVFANMPFVWFKCQSRLSYCSYQLLTGPLIEYCFHDGILYPPSQKRNFHIVKPINETKLCGDLESWLCNHFVWMRIAHNYIILKRQYLKEMITTKVSKVTCCVSLWKCQARTKEVPLFWENNHKFPLRTLAQTLNEHAVSCLFFISYTFKYALPVSFHFNFFSLSSIHIVKATSSSLIFKQNILKLFWIQRDCLITQCWGIIERLFVLSCFINPILEI